MKPCEEIPCGIAAWTPSLVEAQQCIPTGICSWAFWILASFPKLRNRLGSCIQRSGRNITSSVFVGWWCSVQWKLWKAHRYLHGPLLRQADIQPWNMLAHHYYSWSSFARIQLFFLYCFGGFYFPKLSLVFECSYMHQSEVLSIGFPTIYALLQPATRPNPKQTLWWKTI